MQPGVGAVVRIVPEQEALAQLLAEDINDGKPFTVPAYLARAINSLVL